MLWPEIEATFPEVAKSEYLVSQPLLQPHVQSIMPRLLVQREP
jgi:hypothetical protein